MILTLGSIVFDALRVAGFDYGTSWKWAEHATIEDLPALQLIAREPRRPRIELVQHPSLQPLPTLMADLERLGDAGEVMPLQRGSELVGWFVLERVGRKLVWLLPDGTVVQEGLSLELLEHRPGETTPESPRLGVAGREPPERTTPELPDTTQDPSEVPLSEVVRSG